MSILNNSMLFDLVVYNSAFLFISIEFNWVKIV